MRPHNWDRFSFGTWLLNAAPRLYRNKLATAVANKLARIVWSVLRNETTFDINRQEAMAIWAKNSSKYATEKNAWNGSVNASRVWWPEWLLANLFAIETKNACVLTPL